MAGVLFQKERRRERERRERRREKDVGRERRERESIQSLTTLRAYPLCRIEASFGADLPSKLLLSISLSRPDLIGGYTGGVGPNSPL